MRTPAKASRLTLTLSLRTDARPTTPEGRALRIAQQRLRHGQSPTELLIEALLTLEHIPAPTQSLIDHMRMELSTLLHEAFASLPTMPAQLPSVPSTPTLSETTVSQLKKLARLHD